jgi:hypothetical protein
MAFGFHFAIPRWSSRQMLSLDLTTTAQWWPIQSSGMPGETHWYLPFHPRPGNGSWACDGPDSLRDLWGTRLGTRFDAYPVGHSDSGHFQDVRLDVRRAERHR